MQSDGDLKSVQGNIGHATAAVLMDTYAHTQDKPRLELAEKIEAHRKEVHDRIAQEHPELAQKFRERRHILDAHLKERRPEVYELITTLRRKREAGDSSGDRDIQ